VAGATAAAAAGGWSLAGDGWGCRRRRRRRRSAHLVPPVCSWAATAVPQEGAESDAQSAPAATCAAVAPRASSGAAARCGRSPSGVASPAVGAVHSVSPTPPPLNPLPPPGTASGAASAAAAVPSLPPSLPPWQPPAPPHCGGGGAGHGTSRVGRRAVGRPRSRRVERLLLLCGACLAQAFWGCMLRGCSLRFALSLITVQYFNETSLAQLGSTGLIGVFLHLLNQISGRP